MTIDWAAALSDAALLRERNLFVTEGRLLLDRVLSSPSWGPDAVVEVLASPAAVSALRLHERLPGRVVVRTPSEMAAVAGFNFHRGVLALVRRPKPRALLDVIAGVSRWPMTESRKPTTDCRRPLLVVAEHLVDVDNIGACFRNARALGAACVLLDDRCPDPLYRKAIRTSMGAVLDLPWTQGPIGDLLDALERAGITCIALTPHDTDMHPSRAIDDVRALVPAGTPVALLVGNEGDGLSVGTLARCSLRARIPLAEGADSLNVATALAVALFAVR